MDNIYLISFGEIALKGENRPFFERILMQRIRKALKPVDEKAKLQKLMGVFIAFQLRRKSIGLPKKSFWNCIYKSCKKL